MTGTRRRWPRGCGDDRTRTPRRSCSPRRSPRPGARGRRFKPERGAARAWLFGIAQHLLFGYYRRLEVEDRARQRLGVVLEPALDDDADARLDAAALRAELSARLAAAARRHARGRAAAGRRAARLPRARPPPRLLEHRGAPAGLARPARAAPRADRHPRPRRSRLMSVESDVAAVRAALLPAIARDAARRSRRGARIAPLTTIAVLLAGSTAVAAATGVIWSAPKVDHSVPAVARVAVLRQATRTGTASGPVLMRRAPATSLRAGQPETRAGLGRQGRHRPLRRRPGPPLRVLPPERRLRAAVSEGIEVIDLGPADYDIKPLSDAEAHAWLCAHPTQRPGADAARSRRHRGLRDCRSETKRGPQQPVDLAAVGAALGLAHDRADQRAHRLGVAALDALDDVRVARRSPWPRSPRARRCPPSPSGPRARRSRPGRRPRRPACRGSSGPRRR